MDSNWSVKVFVNEAEEGNYVCLLMDGFSLVEYEDGVLRPSVQFSPAHAMKLAEALVAKAGEVVSASKKGRDEV